LGALPKPTLPDGPLRALSERLHALHHRAGWPSLRVMAKEIGCSHTTVSVAFSEPRLPRWGLLELIVETLNGDTDEFHRLWLAASRTTAEPAPEVARVVSPPPGESAPVPPPRQLPADVPAFTGRAAALAALAALLDLPGTAVPVAAISGTAGVGKTALAVHWSHRVAHRFGDGQLYLDLRGYDPDRPVSAGQALEALLHELGVDGSAIPRDLPQRAARYRTLLADRKMLILLDNVHSVEQVRDLLPGTASCFVVVTSRASLPSLVVRYGAVRVNLDLLPAGEATALLRALVGARVDAEPEAAAALAARCARLPLALRIAAELAAARPHASLARLVDELGDESGRLDLLDVGEDDYTAVRTVFSWSLRHLSEPAARTFRLIGLHPGHDLDLAAVSALTGPEPRACERLLGELDRAHLVAEQTPGRYGMHDLLRGYAAEQATQLPARERDAAIGRLHAHYLRTAADAMDVVFSHNRHQRPRLTGSGAVPGPAPTLISPAAARAWLAAEWRNLVACAHAPAADRTGYLGQLTATIAGYLDERGQYDDALRLHEHARTTAAARGDRAAEAVALHDLAVVNRRMGRYQEAERAHQAALRAYTGTGERAGQARSLHGLGVLHWRQGRYQDAHRQLTEAVTAYREVGDAVGEGAALYALGIAARRLGRYAEAEQHHRLSIAVLHEAGDRAGEASARNNLGVVCQFLGRYGEAIEHHNAALEIHREREDRMGQGVSMDNLAEAYRRTDRCDEALAWHRRALELFGEVGYRVGEADSRRGLGAALRCLGRYTEATAELEHAARIGRAIGEAEVLIGALIELAAVQRATGRTAGAAEGYRSALDLAETSGDRYAQARALEGLASLRDDAGDATGARENWERALAHYAGLGLPDADRVRDALTAAR
jgi:tetratricopeptide (TPR) repeat protein